MQIIAFNGKRGAGKDTAADVLVEQGYTRFALTDLTKAIVRDVFGVTVEEQTDRVLKETPLKRYPFKSPRQLDRLVAEEMFREVFDPDVWCHYAVREIRKLKAAGVKKIVIPDVRRPNEAAFLRDAFESAVTIIKIVNPRLRDNDSHPSETEVDDVVPNITIYNERAVHDLKQAVLAITEE
ncbi:putative dNMP kinase [Caulobacter phage CcrSC]|uniref:DNMP kinase n=1 Tax=Caulobacter phage CcrSC TaxID=2283272 RepID=A0A385ED17_9CAUD|nr:putative dNMP kinase [Caulobacter phage CcrSC]AXQ69774.1 putative dNMP kinase [Caulobacter phage CcrSC]